MPVPDFSPGEVLTAAAMDSIGLWLVKTQTIGSAVASVPVNDVFSSSYDNYLVTVNGGASSVGSVLRMQMGATTSNYYYQLIYGVWGASVFGEGNGTSSLWTSVGRGTTSGLQMYCQLFNPNRATPTSMSAFRITTSDVGTTYGLLENTTQYTAFTISPTSGTLTGGTIRVYGYRN